MHFFFLIRVSGSFASKKSMAKHQLLSANKQKPLTVIGDPIDLKKSPCFFHRIFNLSGCLPFLNGAPRENQRKPRKTKAQPRETSTSQQMVRGRWLPELGSMKNWDTLLPQQNVLGANLATTGVQTSLNIIKHPSMETLMKQRRIRRATLLIYGRSLCRERGSLYNMNYICPLKTGQTLSEPPA